MFSFVRSGCDNHRRRIRRAAGFRFCTDGDGDCCVDIGKFSAAWGGCKGCSSQCGIATNNGRCAVLSHSRVDQD